MKHPSAFTELVILVAFMAAWVPMFAILMHSMELSEYTWMRDKTIMDESVSIEWVEREVTDENGHTIKYLVPNVSESTTYKPADILLSLCIFDRYAPDSNVISLFMSDKLTQVEEGTVGVHTVDMSDKQNYIDKYDLLPLWYHSTGLNLAAYDSDDKFYLNWVNYIDKDTGEEKSMWSFREDYDIRYEE